MTTEPRINISPPEPQVPESSRIPTLRSRRWYSSSELAGEHTPSLPIFVTPRAYVGFCAHAGIDLDTEVGGGLAGRWRIDPRTHEHFVVVEAVLPAKHTRQGSAYLTFTQDTLVALHYELEARFPGKRLVGWYHTHPRMGVFLSGYDLWLHEHFFPEAWQIALVIEPYSATGGFFVRPTQGQLNPRDYVGFYELMTAKYSGVVHWANMKEKEIRSDGPPRVLSGNGPAKSADQEST